MSTHTEAGTETVWLDATMRTKLTTRAREEGLDREEVMRRAIARELATTDSEEWRPVPGYEGLYDVSDQGRVRSWRLPGPGDHRTTEPKILETPPNSQSGYRLALISRPGSNRRSVPVAMLVMLAFVGNRPEGQVIRHLNGEKLDNRLENLRYGTPHENADDARFHMSLANSAKTHCKRGHEFTPENTGKGKTGAGTPTRVCRTCAREREAARRAAKRNLASRR